MSFACENTQHSRVFFLLGTLIFDFSSVSVSDFVAQYLIVSHQKKILDPQSKLEINGPKAIIADSYVI